jgi:hypothetical protein
MKAMVESSRDQKPLAICLLPDYASVVYKCSLPLGSCFFHPITNQTEIEKEMGKVQFSTVQRIMFQAN